jgi:hypothetical protein
MSNLRQGLRRRPWIEVFHCEIVPLLSIDILSQLSGALADEPTPSHELVRREVLRALEHMTEGVRPPKGGWQ